MKNKLFLYRMTILLFFSCHQNQIKELEKITYQQQLGRYLFYEKRVSINNTKSCASCHSIEFAFTDGYRKSVTSLGENVPHNAPSLINSVYLKYYDWANINTTNFEQQIKRPLYNHQPIELGLDKHIKELQLFLKNDSLYSNLFKQAFPKTDSLFTLTQIEKAIADYETTLVSTSSNFDENKMDSSAQNGYKLFTSNKLNCATCHPPPYFTLATQTKNIDSVFANIGLYNVGNKNQYPANDNGIFSITKNAKDNGKFKIPSLRNVMLTAPYMHDGSIDNIEQVIDMYANGGRNIAYANNKGNGKLNKNKSNLITGFVITENEKKDLINFLNSLTDSSIFYKHSFQNPFSKN